MTESLGDILRRIAAPRDPNYSPPAELEPECKNCRGVQWVTKAVPVDHPDFGQAFPCPKCTDSTREAVARIRKHADLPTNLKASTFEQFEPRKGTEAMTAGVKEYTANMEPSGFTLVGPPGIGKTSLLTAAGNVLVEQGRHVKYASATRIIEKFRGSFADDSGMSYQRLMEMYQKVEVLLLDDLTEYRVTEFAQQSILDLIDYRYSYGGFYMAASNLTPDQMERFWGERLTDRLLDRHSGQVKVVECWNVPSYRTGQAAVTEYPAYQPQTNGHKNGNGHQTVPKTDAELIGFFGQRGLNDPASVIQRFGSGMAQAVAQQLLENPDRLKGARQPGGIIFKMFQEAQR